MKIKVILGFILCVVILSSFNHNNPQATCWAVCDDNSHINPKPWCGSKRSNWDDANKDAISHNSATGHKATVCSGSCLFCE